jgi:hypothetical protein
MRSRKNLRAGNCIERVSMQRPDGDFSKCLLSPIIIIIIIIIMNKACSAAGEGVTHVTPIMSKRVPVELTTKLAPSDTTYSTADASEKSDDAATAALPSENATIFVKPKTGFDPILYPSASRNPIAKTDRSSW